MLRQNVLKSIYSLNKVASLFQFLLKLYSINQFRSETRPRNKNQWNNKIFLRMGEGFKFILHRKPQCISIVKWLHSQISFMYELSDSQVEFEAVTLPKKKKQNSLHLSFLYFLSFKKFSSFLFLLRQLFLT